MKQSYRKLKIRHSCDGMSEIRIFIFILLFCLAVLYFFGAIFGPQNEIGTEEEQSKTETVNADHPVFSKAKYLWQKDKGNKFCNGSANFVIAVNSVSSNSANRMAIRNTWGSGLLPGIKVLFFVGENVRLNQQIAEEIRTHGDVIDVDVMELRSQLATKMISVLEWLREECGEAKAVVKIDDDAFVNTENLLAFLTPQKLDRKRIYGRLAQNVNVNRNEQSGRFVSQADYSNATFPDFVASSAYVITASAVAAILDAVASVHLLPLDDVYLTGLCAERAEVERVDSELFYNNKLALNPCTVKSAMIINGLEAYNLRVAWRVSKESGNKQCTKTTCLMGMCAKKDMDYRITWMEYVLLYKDA